MSIGEVEVGIQQAALTHAWRMNQGQTALTTVKTSLFYYLCLGSPCYRGTQFGWRSAESKSFRSIGFLRASPPAAFPPCTSATVNDSERKSPIPGEDLTTDL